MFKIIKSIIKLAAQGVYQDPHIQKLINRYPRFFYFLKKRLTPDEKFGLSLTIGIIITLFFIYLFFGIIQDLFGQESLIEADLRIINLVQIFRTSGFNKVMLFITYLGNWQIIVIGIIAIGTVLILLKRWYYFFTVLVSVGIGELFVWVVKNLMDRPRPLLINALTPAPSYSFPSGHVFVAISFYGLLIYFAIISVSSRLLKTLFVIFGAGLVLGVGWSRIYLGVHWSSDVLASMASGAAWLTGLITALEIRRKFKDIEPAAPYLKKAKIILISLVLIVGWGLLLNYYFITHPLKPAPVIAEETIKITEADIPQKLFVNFPKTSENITGKAMEPINIIVIASEAELDRAFRQAGWNKADPITFKNGLKIIKSFFLKMPYPTEPGVPTFWDTMPNDFAYEKHTAKQTIKEREHIHFWKTPFVLNNQKRVWLATAHFDKGIKLISGIIIPNHVIDPAIDKERDRVKEDLINSGLVKLIQNFQIVEPTLGKNQGGDQFFTDGQAYLIFLKP